MVFEYSFLSATKRSPDEILGLLACLHGMRPDDDRLISPGLVTWVEDETEAVVSFDHSAVRFTPTVTVRFDLYENENFDRGREQIVLAAALLLHADQADCALFYSDLPLFVRHNGHLVLNRSASIWDDLTVATLKMPYEFANLSTP